MTELEMVGILTKIIHMQADIIEKQDEVLNLCDVRLDELQGMKEEAESLRRRIEG